MRDTAGFSRGHGRRATSLTLWLSLFLLPVAAMVLLLSSAGRIWLDRGANSPNGAAILPGLTVEAAPSPAGRSAFLGRPASPGHLIVTSIRSGSPASQRGIAVGDTVVAIDGARIFSLDQARRRLQKDHAGTVALRVAHGRELRDVRLLRAGATAKDGVGREGVRRQGEKDGPQAARHRG